MGAVQFEQSLMNMNFYIILTTFFLGAVTASNAVTCDECRKASVDLDVHLLSEESLGEQIAILKLALCPQLEDVAACEAGLDMWFPDMAGCIYNHLIEQDICAMFLPDCTKQTRAMSGEWTCEECTSALATLADYMVQEDTIAEGVNYLQGECFCGRPDQDHTEECPSVIASVVPMALPILGSALVEQSTEHCQEIAGVC